MSTKQKHERGLFIFHRDLRIVDNIGLIQSFVECERVYTCFIFTPEQVGQYNKYRSKRAIQFMIESLVELSSEIRSRGGELIVLFGDPTTVSAYLIRKLQVTAVYTNKDYSPYAIERESKLSSFCESHTIVFTTPNDYYLYEPGSIKTTTGKYYQKFTPFYDAVVDQKVPTPYPYYKRHYLRLSKFSGNLEYKTTLREMMHKYVGTPSQTSSGDGVAVHGVAVHGGRELALTRLRRATREMTEYDIERDYFIFETTLLSAYIKFGCVSIREVYHSFKHTYGIHSGIIRELIWREFFAHILYGFPGVLNGYRYKDIEWRKSHRDFDKWAKGKTGFPIVDACMRQLNETGYMHNRGRMVVANFLVKTLLINWKWGETYFAQHLVDYDPASNNGNWLSISGTGVDQKPYFRDMNPWIQSAKFDKDAEYIKRWVPELKEVESRVIHKWDLYCTDPKYKGVRYPKPMVSYGEQKVKMLEMYREVV